MVTIQSKLASTCILFEINVHETSQKSTHYTTSSDDEYVATLKELRQVECNLDYIDGDGNGPYRAKYSKVSGEWNFHS